MTFGSICSGIEAASVAWSSPYSLLAWTPRWFMEIDPFCRRLLKFRHSGVHNFGNLIKAASNRHTIRYLNSPAGRVDVLVGGTPCQDFSVAGRRLGMGGRHAGVLHAYLSLVEQTRPKWLVWENVPGVLSIDHGRVFGSFLQSLGDRGYGFAYRVLDAQYWGVAQRRKRVFVVGCLGDWRGAAAVLFEQESVSGDIKEGGEEREETAGTLGGGSGARGWCDDTDRMTFVPRMAYGGNNTSGPIDIATARNGHSSPHGRLDFESETFIVNQSVGFSCKDYGADALDNLSPTLRAMGHDGSHANAGGQLAVAFDTTQITSRTNRSNPQPNDPCHTLAKGSDAPSIAYSYGVRRLTPIECERLQGFSDNYTLIPRASDGPRYKSIGNSFAVPVIRWIGERIELVDQVMRSTC